MVRGRTGGEPSTSRRQFYIGTRLVKFPMKKIRGENGVGKILTENYPCAYVRTKQQSMVPIVLLSVAWEVERSLGLNDSAIVP